eukprot:CAMPEP_0196996750 /NCGR_PEP_ID=MMETSP1380-20130617/2548_1 /TAXON_ID=5936 /ORGANISM="Euplotes crassus, Strain CT5" /LENGTH=315 /DNA_ID=CAMNT_0042412805 /DNA_START=47 /DNA_END=994 /DNA_ORIENTATION=+
MTNGTIKPTSGFNGMADAEALRKAMKGIGTDEKELINVICARTSAELKQVEIDFKTQFGKDLIADIRSETSGNFREVLCARIQTRAHYDAECLRKAIAGAGTDEACLIEILATRSNAEIKAIREEYKKAFGKDLEKDIDGDTSGDFKRILISLAQGNRDETSSADSGAAATDAQALYKAGEGKIGTDESKFNQILASRSTAQIKLINEEYKKISKKDLVKAIDSEMSGWVKDGMIAIVEAAIDRPTYFAERLYKSMKGAGTDDRTLIRIVVSRCEVDMVEIKEAFQKKYGKSLAKFIEEDTSGDYKKALVKLVGA